MEDPNRHICFLEGATLDNLEKEINSRIVDLKSAGFHVNQVHLASSQVQTLYMAPIFASLIFEKSK